MKSISMQLRNSSAALILSARLGRTHNPYKLQWAVGECFMASGYGLPTVIIDYHGSYHGPLTSKGASSYLRQGHLSSTGTPVCAAYSM